MTKKLVSIFMIFCLLQTACAPNQVMVKNEEDIKNELPQNFLEYEEDEYQKDKSAEKKEKEVPKNPLSPESIWKDYFSDPYLVSLIDQALANSQELKIVMQEIEVSKAEMTARQGEIFPKVDIGGEAGVEKVGKLTSQGVSDANDQYEPGKFVPEDLQNYSLGLKFSWEVDIWKKLRNATKASLYRYMASVDGKNFVRSRLIAELASSYYELMALDNLLSIVEENIDIQKEALELIKLQMQAARVTALAVKRFEAEVLKNRSRLYELKQRITQTENKINFLVGRYPQKIQRNSIHFKDIDPQMLNAGIPSQLLDRRPDVRAAQNKLKAADLDIEVARARFYPSLSIDAGAGYESFNSNHLFTPESVFYNVAGNLTAPLINRQGIKAAYRAANAMQIQSVFEYEKTLLNAYTEVANQLAKVKNFETTYSLKEKQVSVLNESVEISGVLFKAARADYVEVLMTRRDALEAQMELIEIKMELLTSFSQLYQSLGGGWDQKHSG